MIRAFLSPLRGWSNMPAYPQLALWAEFLRRFAAGEWRTLLLAKAVPAE